MASEDQIKANRQNAKHSTGAKTPEGKDAIKYNACKHNIFTVVPVLPWENDQEYKEHYQAIMEDLKPEGAIEMLLADRVVLHSWRLMRVLDYELEVNTNAQFREYRHEELEKVNRYEGRIERSMLRVLAELRNLQFERGAYVTRQSAEAQARGENPPPALKVVCKHRSRSQGPRLLTRNAESPPTPTAEQYGEFLKNNGALIMKIRERWEEEQIAKLKSQSQAQAQSQSKPPP